MERWPKIKMWKYILRKKMLYGIGFVCVLIGMTVTGVCIKPAKEVQASISYEAVKDIRSDAPGGGEGVSEQPEGETTDDKDDPLDMLGDLSEIEAAVSEAMTVRSSVSFKAILKQLMTGSLSEAGQLLFQMIREQVAETGFYLTYTLLMTLMMTSFMMTSAIVRDVLHSLTEFMKVLLPTFCTALTFTTGSLLSGAYYELMMIAIAAADWLMSSLIMKMIQVYVLTALVNHISKEDYLSKLSELLALLIRWSIRTVVGVILGINILQTMLLPAIDRAKETVAYKLISAVPGVGTAMNTAVGAVIGSGVLIRNVLGMGSLLIILLICAVPVVRVCMVLLSYKIVQAVIQPVTEKRLLEGMDAMTQGVGMLLHVLVSCVLMFILSLAVVCNAAAVVAV